MCGWSVDGCEGLEYGNAVDALLLMPSSLLPGIPTAARPFLLLFMCMCLCLFALLPLTTTSAEGNSPNHNLQMYLHNIDPTRDVALMNKVR